MSGARALAIARRHSRLRIDRRSLSAAVACLDAQAGRFRGGCPGGLLTLAFLPDRTLAALHGRFLGDPSPTDVITFPGIRGAGSSGEICVSVDAAVRRAGRTARRLSAELTLYLVHGWLHLAGYDDTTAPARRAMRRAEARALGLLGRAGAMPRFSLA
jgi:probable rRNA maturation factor